MNLAKFLDHANHRTVSTKTDIQKLCNEVLKYSFNSAFVNPCWVKFAREILGNKGKVGTVISFPIGQDSTEIKLTGALEAINNGADELDISTNIGWLKANKDENYLREMVKLTKAAKKGNSRIIVKFIIEACLLTKNEIKKASHYVLQSGADFVKTTSGFGSRDAKIEYVKIIKSVVQDKIKIKAAGGIKNAKQVKEYIAAGADRIGTSKAVEIVGLPLPTSHNNPIHCHTRQ